MTSHGHHNGRREYTDRYPEIAINDTSRRFREIVPVAVDAADEPRRESERSAALAMSSRTRARIDARIHARRRFDATTTDASRDALDRTTVARIHRHISRRTNVTRVSTLPGRSFAREIHSRTRERREKRGTIARPAARRNATLDVRVRGPRGIGRVSLASYWRAFPRRSRDVTRRSSRRRGRTASAKTR